MDFKEIYDIRVAMHRGHHTEYNHEIELGLEIARTNSYKAAEEADAMYRKFKAEELAKRIKSIEGGSAAAENDIQTKIDGSRDSGTTK